ncbi:hypothetical protein GCM10009809_14300 [Isoptericola hypogeus]|uniref:DUF5666 domain-containing protein n=1 Tax=Isoptericola hypogeus TaxID=300179 RepID=A0ABP4V8I0_9MICO
MRTTRRRRPVLAPALLAVLLSAAACGGPSPEEASPEEAGGSPAATPTTEEPPAPPHDPSPSGSLPGPILPTAPPTVPSDAGTKLRLVGVVVDSLDGYVVLRDDNDIAWALTGDVATSLQTGEHVQVTGRSRPDATAGGYPVVLVERAEELPASP